MSRFLGYAKKLNYRITRLENSGGIGGVAEAMRIHAQTGKMPVNPLLREKVQMMMDMAVLMAQTVPGWVPPEPDETVH